MESLDLRQFHDALVESVECGPRRELRIVLMVLKQGEGPQLIEVPAELRFGAVDNIDEVRRFADGLTRLSPKGYLDSVDSVKQLDKGLWRVELDLGGGFVIRTRKPPVLTWRDAG